MITLEMAMPTSEDRFYSIHHHQHHHHHHPEGVACRSFCLNSNTFAVSEMVSRRWLCVESLFPLRPTCMIRICTAKNPESREFGDLPSSGEKLGPETTIYSGGTSRFQILASRVGSWIWAVPQICARRGDIEAIPHTQHSATALAPA